MTADNLPDAGISHQDDQGEAIDHKPVTWARAKKAVTLCASCGRMTLRKELDEYGNGPCCPSRTRLVRSDKGMSRKGGDQSGPESSGPAASAGQGHLFPEGG